MIRGLLTLSALISTVLFPWPLTALLGIVAAIFEPLVPLAVGIFADTLYWSPQLGTIPLLTLCGALATILAFFVRSRLETRIIGE